MKITVSQLRKIIKEEVNKTLSEEDYSSWKQNIHGEEEEIFPAELMQKLPKMLGLAYKNAKKRLEEPGATESMGADEVKQAKIMMEKMKELAELMQKFA